jgi:predicted lipid-binding transport protein (Tim44 family)
MMIRGYEIGARAIAASLMALAFVLLLVFSVSQCKSKKTAQKQAEVAAGQAGAAVESGVVAVETAANVVANDNATDAQVAAAQATIAAAAKGQKGKAARSAACKFKAYKDTPQCAR